MNKPSVSVIIPVYNVEKYLEQCVDSVMRQELQDIEVVLIDDGSPDSCPQICDELAEKDARIKVIHQENGGVSRARNKGIEESSGKWLYFVDSDDWLIDNSLGELLAIGERENADVVFSDCFECYDDGTTRRIHLFSSSFSSDQKDFIQQIQMSILCHRRSPFFSKGADSAYPAPWSKLIKASLVKDNGISFDPSVLSIYDDGLFTTEILEVAQKIAYFETCTYNYRILGTSIVHSYKKDLVERFEKNCIAMHEFIERNHKGTMFVHAEYARRVAYFSSMLSDYFFHTKNEKSYKDTRKELKKTMSRSPWEEAIEDAWYSDLEMKHRYTLFCMRHGIIYGLKCYTIAKRILKKH